jgi:hypothetical protein
MDQTKIVEARKKLPLEQRIGFAEARDVYEPEIARLEGRLTAIYQAIFKNDPYDMAADGVTCLDVWRKEAYDWIVEMVPKENQFTSDWPTNRS